MKTLKEIRNSEAQSRYGQSYNDCLEWVDRKELSQMDEQIAKDFAIEVAKEALKNAAENAEAEYLCYKGPTVYDDAGHSITVNKESIRI